jgi:hypothetical protein
LEKPLRPHQVEDDWEPELRELTESEIEKILKEKERSSRRLRRSQKFVPYTRTSSMSSMYGSTRTFRSGMRVPTMPPQFVTPAPRVTLKNYQPTPEEISIYKQYNPQFNAPTSVPMQPPPTINTTDIVSKQVEMMKQGSLSPVKSPVKSEYSDDHAPPTRHRGFGASASAFNLDGTIEVGGKQQQP